MVHVGYLRTCRHLVGRPQGLESFAKIWSVGITCQLIQKLYAPIMLHHIELKMSQIQLRHASASESIRQVQHFPKAAI